MATLKTTPQPASVQDFLNAIPDEQKRKDAQAILKLMQSVTKAKPKLWGGSIVGFGNYHYKYASGREGDSFLAGFSPRKQNFTLYLMPGLEQQGALLKKLGKHKIGKGCLYVKQLADVDVPTLKALIAASVAHLQRLYFDNVRLA